MNKEDIDFLKDLQQEMLTQDTVCQANPRFWVVMQTVRDYWVDDDVDGIFVYSPNDAETVYEGQLEDMVDWLKKQFDIIEKCEYDYDNIEITCEDGEEIAKDTMFLTLRECKEHIERNHYHYNKPHPYAMSAWRSPQVERLYKILEKTNWDEIKINL